MDVKFKKIKKQKDAWTINAKVSQTFKEMYEKEEAFRQLLTVMFDNPNRYREESLGLIHHIISYYEERLNKGQQTQDDTVSTNTAQV